MTMGSVVSGRMSLPKAAAYRVAQFPGGILGALVLWALGAPSYTRSAVGLGADG